MLEGNDPKVYSLIAQAVHEAQKRNRAKVKGLMEQAIQLSKNAGVSTVTLYTLRERLLVENYADIPQLVAALRTQLSFYEESDHISGQVDTLRALSLEAARMGKKAESLAFLDHAEQILNSLKEDDFTKISVELRAKSTIAAREFLRTRTSMILRLKTDVSKIP